MIEKIKVLKNINLSNYTNTKTGGVISAMYYPHTLKELIDLLKYIKLNCLDFQVLAGMTNVVISNRPLNFVIINMCEFNISDPVLHSKNLLTVSSGYEMKKLTKWCYSERIRSLEWMEGIPGTVGAGVYMNAGFLIGQDMGTYLEAVEFLNLDTLMVEKYRNQDLNYRYRYSKLQDMNVIILSATFLIKKLGNSFKNRLKLLKSSMEIKKYHKRRHNNQPTELPSAGTVFIPPMPYHVGGILRELKLVGYQIGGAQISLKSPGFIVNTGNMTGEDYYSLVRFIQKVVKEEYSLDLISEVKLIGFDKIDE